MTVVQSVLFDKSRWRVEGTAPAGMQQLNTPYNLYMTQSDANLN